MVRRVRVLAAAAFTVWTLLPGPAWAVGETCQAPFLIPIVGGGVFLDLGQTTCGAGDDYATSEGCPGDDYLGAEDFVYVFTPTVDGEADISVASLGAPAGIFVVEGCPFDGCLVSATSPAGFPFVAGAPLEAGSTYYIVVSGTAPPICMLYDFYLTYTPDPPIPPGPGSIITLPPPPDPIPESPPIPQIFDLLQTTGTFEVELFGFGTLEAQVSGVTIVGRSAEPSDGSAPIVSEIVAMDLEATGPLGPVEVRAGRAFGLPVSSGTITPLAPPPFFPAGSFFDVVVEIVIEDQRVRAVGPFRVAADIGSIPPFGTTYADPPGQPPVSLVDAGTGEPVGLIRHAAHTVTAAQVPATSPASRIVLGLLLVAGVALLVGRLSPPRRAG